MRNTDGSSSHNLFGIKATGNWQGEQARAITSEFRDGQFVKETAAFRSYDSYGTASTTGKPVAEQFPLSRCTGFGR